MRIIGAIAAMTRERVIGKGNEIPWHYSADFKRFKRITLGGTLLMGRNTWQSIGSKPLPGRRNIVISRKGVDEVECYGSVDGAFAAAFDTAFDAAGDDQPIWIIGGGQIYHAAMQRCNLLDITIVPDDISPSGAVLFPKIDLDKWLPGPIVEIAQDPRLSCQRYILHSDADLPAAQALLNHE